MDWLKNILNLQKDVIQLKTELESAIPFVPDRES